MVAENLLLGENPSAREPSNGRLERHGIDGGSPPWEAKRLGLLGWWRGK